MTNQQILEKAIKKAIDNGWEPIQTPFVHNWIAGKNSDIPILLDRKNLRKVKRAFSTSDILFNHDFAKALFGKERIMFTQYDFKNGKTLGDNVLPAYLYHLQQMVIAPDPIKYLGEHLDA